MDNLGMREGMTNVEQASYTIDQDSVALMVSADTCMQVVQGSIPTDGWKVIWNTTAFSGCGI